MPRDQRLYMTFPNDFHRHPKVSRLSDAEFRAFVELNGEARIADNDGVFNIDEAEFLWTRQILDALVSSHPTRPLVLRDDQHYVIRDYAEHQQTRAQREERAETNRANGRKGGRPRTNRSETESVTQSVANGLRVVTEPKAEIETEPEIKTSSKEEVSTRKRAHSIPENFTITDEMRAWASDAAPLVDVDAKLAEFITYWLGVGKPMKDWEQTWRNGMLKQQGFAERDMLRNPQAQPRKRHQFGGDS